MKKRLLSMMIIISMVSFYAVPYSQAATSQTGELMVNGSFEEVDPNDTADAMSWEQNGSTASTDFHNGTGSRSIKLNSSNTSDPLVSVTQDVYVVAGEEYKFWFKIYEHTNIGGADRKTEVIVRYLDADGVQVGADDIISSYDAVNRPGVWGKTEVFRTIPVGVEKVRIFAYAENFTGSYYYDLFSLTGAIPSSDLPLTAPTDLTAEAVSYDAIYLDWTASDGNVWGYRVLRDGAEVGDITDTSFTDTGLTGLTEYSYTVEAYNPDEPSQSSAAVSATTFAAPVVSGEILLNSNFEAYEGGTLKPTSWIVSEGVTSTDEYRRHGSRSLKMVSPDLITVTSASQEFNALDQHIYRLRGFFHDPNGVGDAKNPDRISQVIVHYFNASNVEIGSDVLAHYDKNTTDTAVYKEFITNFATPEGTKKVRLRMHAEQYVGFFLYDWFQMSSVGPEPVPAAPAAPTVSVASETEIDLSWPAVTGYNVESYQVYRDGVAVGVATVNSFNDSGLTPNTTYSYTVTAINNIGESAQSAASVIITDTTPPTKPVLHADAESSTKIVLRWKGVDDNVKVTDHEVYRNGLLLDDSGVIMGLYEDAGLTPGTTYNYAVIAKDGIGNKSVISNTAYATTFDNDTISDYVEGMIQLNYYINEANAGAIYRLGPGYAGETGLTARAVVDLPGDAVDLIYSQTITDATKTVINIPISSLAVGEYSVALSILDGGQIIWATEDSIVKEPPATGDTRITQVDHDREILLVDGEPYYPLGVFGVDADSLQQLADAGFNTTLRWKGYTTWPSYNMELSPDDPYNTNVVNSYLDAVQDAGLYAFESPVKLAEEQYYHNYKDPNWDTKYPVHNDIITPGVLQTSAAHSAVIGYYSYDEVDNFYECCPAQSDHIVMQHGVEEWYDIVKDRDPYHSVMTLFAVGVSKNADWSAWDIVARDYYFNDTKHMSDIYKYMKQSAITADEWNDPFIATPLLEESSAQRKPLNGVQQRASTYSSVIAGARGLYYWDWAAVYNDNWDMLQQVIGEINQLQPVLTERIPLQNIAYADGSVHQFSSSNAWTGMSKSAQGLVMNHNNKTYLITVNTENAPIEVSFTLPAEHSGKGTVWFEDRTIEVVNGTFTDTFEPYARHVYELQGTWAEGNTVSMDVAIAGDETVYVDPLYAPATKNMLLNSSFEESYGSTPNVPAEWTNADSVMNAGQTGPSGEWHIDDDESYHGDASMRLTEKEGGTFDDIFLYQVPGIFQGDLTYQTGGTYTYSVWMKADRPNVMVTLQEGWTTFENIEVGTEWARYEVQIEKSTAGSGFAALYVLDQGTVWVDAMQMELAAAATEYEAPVLTNSENYTGSVLSPGGPVSFPWPVEPVEDKDELESLDPEIRYVSAAELWNAVKGKVIIILEKRHKLVSLPPNAAQIMGENSLEIHSDKVKLHFQASLFQALHDLDAYDTESEIIIQIDTVKDGSTIFKEALDQSKEADSSSITFGGPTHIFNLSLINYNDESKGLTQFTDDVEVQVPFDPEAVDNELIGVYYYNEESMKWEYIGGTINVEANIINVNLSHFSKYAVIELDKTFKDVTEDYWAFRTVKILSAKHIVKGVTYSEFKPEQFTTRAEFTALITRALDLTHRLVNPFTDVATDAWYVDAVCAAFEAGIVNGITDSTFNPEAEITREQMAAMVVRAYEYRFGQGIQTEDMLIAFEDGYKVSNWAENEVNKALSIGLLQGKGNSIFAPEVSAKRAETAQVVLNLLQQ